MDEYIEREAAIRAVLNDSTEQVGYSREDAADCIRYMDAADVEPVVRCRECKHHCWVQEPCHGKSVHYCKLPHMRGIEIFKEFFCYYGEQKEGAD